MRERYMRHGKRLIACAAAIAVLVVHGDGDWLLDPSRYKATVRETGGAWILENGLARREIATRPGAATTSFKCLATGEELVRGVSPEARERSIRGILAKL